MILNLISLSTVKSQLGIVGTTYDTQINNMIPVVSSDIRRILNCDFNKYVTAAFSSSSAVINFGSSGVSVVDPAYFSYMNQFELGQVMYHPNLPADTYLQSFDPLTGVFTLSATPTGVGTYVYPSVNICQFPAISKMIWYRIQKQNTSSVNERDVTSESYGPVTVHYADSEINSQYNYPQILIDDLGFSYAKVG